MKVDWDEIFFQEELSFKRYYSESYDNIENAVQDLTSDLEQNANRYNRIASEIGLPPRKLTVDVENPNLKNLLEATRTAHEKYSKFLITMILTFLNKYQSFPIISYQLLHDVAKNLEFDTTNENWLSEYLSNIPILNLWGRDLTAYLKPFKGKIPYVVISSSLNQLIQVYLVSGLITYLENYDVDNDPFNQLNNFKPNTDLVIKLIIDTAKHYLGQNNSPIGVTYGKNKITINESHANVLVMTPTHANFKFSLEQSIKSFVLLHEYAHVLFNHHFKKHDILDEVRADVLALNILLDDITKFYNLDVKDDLLEYKQNYIAINILAPIIFFYFLAVINGIEKFRIVESHPHPLTRVMYCNAVILKTFENRGDILKYYMVLMSRITRLFEDVLFKLDVPDDFAINLDISYLDNCGIPVFPVDSTPAYFKGAFPTA